MNFIKLFFSTATGAFIIRSCAFLFIEKNITSRILAISQMNIILSVPGTIPACVVLRIQMPDKAHGIYSPPQPCPCRLV